MSFGLSFSFDLSNWKFISSMESFLNHIFVWVQGISINVEFKKIRLRVLNLFYFFQNLPKLNRLNSLLQFSYFLQVFVLCYLYCYNWGFDFLRGVEYLFNPGNS